MRIDMITLFPEMFAGPFGASITKRAVDKGILDIHFTNFRDYSFDKHRHVDDSPFGGGAGMVLKPEPMYRAVRVLIAYCPAATLIVRSVSGRATPLRYICTVTVPAAVAVTLTSPSI